MTTIADFASEKRRKSFLEHVHGFRRCLQHQGNRTHTLTCLYDALIDTCGLTKWKWIFLCNVTNEKYLLGDTDFSWFWRYFKVLPIESKSKNLTRGNSFPESIMLDSGYGFVQIKSSRRRIVNISSQKNSTAPQSGVRKRLETAV